LNVGLEKPNADAQMCPAALPYNHFCITGNNASVQMQLEANNPVTVHVSRGVDPKSAFLSYLFSLSSQSEPDIMLLVPLHSWARRLVSNGLHTVVPEKQKNKTFLKLLLCFLLLRSGVSLTVLGTCAANRTTICVIHDGQVGAAFLFDQGAAALSQVRVHFVSRSIISNHHVLNCVYYAESYADRRRKIHD
jgi:hypothetical protein